MICGTTSQPTTTTVMPGGCYPPSDPLVSTDPIDPGEGPKTTDDAAKLQREAQDFQLKMFGLQNQGDKYKAMIELLKDSSRKIAN
jgi:hypothetical protein